MTATGPQQLSASQRLAALEPECSSAAALAFFDDLPAVRAEELTGRWKGRELRTGHRLDGLLTASGWHGKQFDDTESVHPLLFSAGGSVFPVEPRKMPLSLAGKVPVRTVDVARKLLGAVGPAVRTSKPRARLRNLEHRGVVTASMIYDHLPIIDSFRRVDEDTLLGVMDERGEPQPYVFILSRDVAR